MVFRKLYWVVEHVQPEGASYIHGVFTSIPSLLNHGISGNVKLSDLRLSLTRLDADPGVLGSWCGEGFQTLDKDLKRITVEDDFSEEQRKALAHWVNERLVALGKR